ncbi:RNA polymerase sigma factor [Solibacillus sp. FSL H8-0538]|uniref:RNA polymerase sigma factor n=1 Tax=Solibacillus sp. FSL H8-0538 TaxID=2921400 RepID=UPI0030F77469
MAFQFERNFILHNKAIFHYIYFLVGNKETAEDLTQETFLKAIQGGKSFRGDAEMKTWLTKIARNTVYDHFRRRKVIRFIPFLKSHEEIDHTYEPESWLLHKAEDYRLYAALGQLKFEFRDAIVLRKIEGYSIKETAKILEYSEAKVKNCTERGMKALRELLGGESDEFR